MTYQTALEIARYLGVISKTGFAELVAKHSDKLSLECPNEFIDTIENSPRVITKTVHVNTIKVGDRVIISDGDSVIVTATEITGKGYQRLFGRNLGENYSFMIFDQDCLVTVKEH